MTTREQQIAALEKDWAENPRWKGIKRGYTAADVVRLRGSLVPESTFARAGAEKLWELLHTEDYINCLGALTGGQAMQQVKAGIKAIYLSGWQVAADNNSYMAMYPDQSLYPVNSVPTVVERINSAFQRADQIQWSKGIQPGDKGHGAPGKTHPGQGPFVEHGPVIAFQAPAHLNHHRFPGPLRIAEGPAPLGPQGQAFMLTGPWNPLSKFPGR